MGHDRRLKRVFGFLIAFACGVLAFALISNANYGPKKPKRQKPRKPTIEDVWSTIRSAQKTVEDSYDLIYGRPGE